MAKKYSIEELADFHQALSEKGTIPPPPERTEFKWREASVREVSFNAKKVAPSDAASTQRGPIWGKAVSWAESASGTC